MSQLPVECNAAGNEEKYTDEDYYTEIDIVVEESELEEEDDDYHSYYYCCDFLNWDTYSQPKIGATSAKGSYEANLPNLDSTVIDRDQQSHYFQSLSESQQSPGADFKENVLNAAISGKQKCPNSSLKQMERSKNVLDNESSYTQSNYLKNTLFSTGAHLRYNIFKSLHSPLLHRPKALSSPLKTAICNFINYRLRYQLL